MSEENKSTVVTEAYFNQQSLVTAQYLSEYRLAIQPNGVYVLQRAILYTSANSARIEWETLPTVVLEDKIAKQPTVVKNTPTSMVDCEYNGLYR